MEADETLNSSSAPSTSKIFSFFEKDAIFVDVCGAMLDFGKLAIDSNSPYTRKKMTPAPPPSPAPMKEFGSSRICIFKKNHNPPYTISHKTKKQRRKPKTIPPLPNRTEHIDRLSKVVLKGDVDPLKLCLFDRKELVQSSCSIQAARPPSPAPDEDIDELSEYFAHFVRVDLKMSALAESMYV